MRLPVARTALTDSKALMAFGILPFQAIKRLVENGAISGLSEDPAHPPSIQPASLDLCLGETALRLRASFLPGRGATVFDSLESIVMHTIDLTGGAVLETGCVYLIPLKEKLKLPDDIVGLANPKSSTGRLDVFTRVICDGGEMFDTIPAGYEGPLFMEVAPRTFPILVRPGDRLGQIRFRRGMHQALETQHVSIDLESAKQGTAIGYRAKRHSGLVDLPGFFDPGFGVREAGGEGSRAVLEVRGRDVPFILRHGQAVAKLIFEPMAGKPNTVYGAQGSHYQSQGLRLSKHFKSIS